MPLRETQISIVSLLLEMLVYYKLRWFSSQKISLPKWNLSFIRVT